MLDHSTGAGFEGDFRLDFDSRVRLQVHGSKISSDGGSLLFLDLDETSGLHGTVASAARAITRGLYSTRSATLSAAPCGGAMFTAPMAGRRFWLLLSPVTENVT